MRSELADAIERMRIQNYPLLYENFQAVGVLVSRAFLEPDELRELDREAAAATPQERGTAVLEFIQELDQLDPVFDAMLGSELPPVVSEDLPESQLQKAVGIVQAMLAAALASFYEYLSVAVHGERLSSLVLKAKLGDDLAYARAVQIDPRILTGIPYFKTRYERLSAEDNEAFRELVFRKQVEPPYRGRLRHKRLFMTFAYLESLSLLEGFSGEELLDFCQDIGSAEEIDDVKNLRKLLARYKRFQAESRVNAVIF